MNADAIAAKDGAKLIGEAHKLCADLTAARPRTYWTDLALTALAAYAGLAAMLVADAALVRILGGVAAVLAIYRGISFVHEVSHLRKDDVPGFKAGYNALIGVPFLVPSFMYEGVHNLHHAKSRYGTVADPEYLPLARQTLWHVAAFVAVSALAPVGLLIRFAVLAPLSALVPALRRATRERFSALAINPAFRREPLTEAQARLWFRLEIACAAWAMLFVGATLAGLISWTSFGLVLLVGAGVGTLNQVRTLAAHHWENEGEEMSAAEQFLDSVTVPPPATLPVLWAPVGLRYHALHHLLPRLPYHNLAAAHARLCELLPETSAYHQASAPSFRSVMDRLFGELAKRRAERQAAGQPAE
ncbi:fatty acid desaturase family protein [Aureimonas leprariae]|uniref:Fatty acid desaturase n=1 Tax=Plantimonas leprariae TaxID=2615207 RepID=A0A7V7PLE7_9HYPH|nr:fatty acid desaturase [Aureimonas leprariae]KAB0677182.1 fatty acid desaturase [Aureimonas leprariae]